MGEWDNYCDEIGEVCKDLETQAVRIAELEKMAEARKLANRLLEQERNELEAERDRLREALKEVLNCEVVTDNGDYSKGGTGFDCNEVKEIIRGALSVDVNNVDWDYATLEWAFNGDITEIEVIGNIHEEAAENDLR